MKRAKFFLTAIIILAVIGGALAFKVAREGRYFISKNVYCGANVNIPTSCTSTLNYRTTPLGFGENFPSTTKPCDAFYALGTVYYTMTVDALNNLTCTSILVTGTVYATNIQ